MAEGQHNGKVLYVVRGQAPIDGCNAIAQAFDHYIAHYGGNREGDAYVLTTQIGATQFSRGGTDYTAETLRLAGAVSALFQNVSQDTTDALFLTRFLENGFLDLGFHFGPARYKSGYANFATFRRWLDNGAMSLMPHEDKAQLAFARQDGFEIGSARRVIAFNVCIEATGSGGDLTVWNLEPDEACRQTFGVEQTGYPYPPQHLQGVESFSVRLNPGDVYFLNAGLLHGVQTVRQGQRLTAGRFIGQISDRKVVYWT